MGLYHVRINYHAAQETLTFISRKKAEAAYTAVRDGLTAYREFKNDYTSAVTVDLECGGKATYRFDRMDSVSLLFPTPDRLERAFIADQIRIKEMKATIAAADTADDA